MAETEHGRVTIPDDLLDGALGALAVCCVPGCGRPVLYLNLCSPHYHRNRRHGNPLGGTTGRGEAERFFAIASAYSGDDCLLWPYGRNNMGYACMTRRSKPRGESRLVHRRLCIIENGPPPTPKHEAAHNCGRGADGCVTKSHLQWKTHTENMADTVKHGTHISGERVPNSKLTEIAVREIRAIGRSIPLTPIARQFGVSTSTISLILRNEIWVGI